MRTRTLCKNGPQVSQIGLGCEHLQGKDAGLIREVVDEAISCGINIFDVFMSEPEVRTNIGAALGSRRDQVFLQAHIGAIFEDGQYARSRDAVKCEAFINDFLKRYSTDYVDAAMLHFVDTMEEYDAVFSGPVMEYAQALKAKGVARHLGMSTHIPKVAYRAAESGLIDVILFSLNPAFDLLPDTANLDNMFEGSSYQGLTTVNPERTALYECCERRGVGITVMKTFLGGLLFNDKLSPLGKPLPPEVLISYALSRPGVKSVMIGCQTPDEVRYAAKCEAADADWAKALSELTAYKTSARCVYCNHCHPCPSGIDIAAVNRLYDLARAADSVPPTVKQHYAALESKAGDCVECGLCETRCPFGCDVRGTMRAAKNTFGM